MKAKVTAIRWLVLGGGLGCMAVAWLLCQPRPSDDGVDGLFGKLDVGLASATGGAAAGEDSASATLAAPIEPLAPGADDVTTPDALKRSLRDARPIRLTGRVVDLAGVPVTAATLWLLPSTATQDALMSAEGSRLTGANVRTGAAGGGEGSVALRFAARVETDSDGRFSLEDWVVSRESKPASGWSAEGDEDPVVIVCAQGFAYLAKRCAGLREGALDVGTLVVEPEAVLTGRIVDEEGRPFAGVPVSGHSWGPRPVADRGSEDYRAHIDDLCRAVSGTDGRFEIRGVWPGRAYLHFDGWRWSVEGLDCPAGRTDVGDVGIARARVIRGVVVDERGIPIEGALAFLGMAGPIKVSIEYPMGAPSARDLLLGRALRSTRTDAAGRFELALHYEDRSNLVVFDDRHVETWVPDIASATSEVRVEMATRGRLRLRLADGPIAGAQARAIAHAAPIEPAALGRGVIAPSDVGLLSRWDAGEERPCVPAPDGDGWIIEGAGVQATDVFVSAPGSGVTIERVEGCSPGAAIERTVALTQSVSLAGTVHDADGRALAGAEVSVSPADTSFSRHFALRTVSDAEGRYRLDSLSAGAWTAVASGRDFLAVSPQQLDIGTRDRERSLDFVLAAAGGIEGHLRADDAAPVAGETIELFRDLQAFGLGRSGKRLHLATTDRDGRFRFRGLEPGAYSVMVEANPPAAVTVVAGETAEVELQLQRRARVRGRVLAGSTPVAGATIHPWLGGGGCWTEAVTSSDGQFEIPLYGPGEYELQVSTLAGRSTPALQAEFRFTVVEPGQVIDVEIEMGSGRIGGVVLDAVTRLPLAGTVVELTGDVATSVTTDDGGRFTFLPLRDGSYIVRAAGATHFADRVDGIELTGGGSREDLELLLEPGAAGLVIESVDAWGKPDRLRTTLRLTRGEQVWEPREDTPGVYRFEALAPGEYELRGLAHSNTRRWPEKELPPDAGELLQTIRLDAGRVVELPVPAGVD